MKRMGAIKDICCLGVGLIFFANTFAQSVQVKLSSDSTRLRLGEQTTISLEATHSPSQQVILPGLMDTLNGLEVVRYLGLDTVTVGTNMITQILNLRVTSFDSGLYKVGPLPVVVNQQDTVYSNELVVYYNSIQVDPQGEIRPIKGPANAPISLADILPWVLGLFLIIGIITAIITYYKKKKKEPEPEVAPVKVYVPPHIIAFRKIEELEEKKLWQKGEVKSYYVDLTDIVREYIEKQFNILALESTTDEILDSLGHKQIDFKQKRILQELLQTSDLVKFAKSKPNASKNMNAVELAKSFVNLTKQEEALSDEKNNAIEDDQAIDNKDKQASSSSHAEFSEFTPASNMSHSDKHDNGQNGTKA